MENRPLLLGMCNLISNPLLLVLPKSSYEPAVSFKDENLKNYFITYATFFWWFAQTRNVCEVIYWMWHQPSTNHPHLPLQAAFPHFSVRFLHWTNIISPGYHRSFGPGLGWKVLGGSKLPANQPADQQPHHQPQVGCCLLLLEAIRFFPIFSCLQSNSSVSAIALRPHQDLNAILRILNLRIRSYSTK